MRDWHLAADLDGAGRCEIFVPYVDGLGPGVPGSYGGIRMLDGVTGAPQWDCPLYLGTNYAYDSLIHLLGAPDLDADGTRNLFDVVVVPLVGLPIVAYTTALVLSLVRVRWCCWQGRLGPWADFCCGWFGGVPPRSRPRRVERGARRILATKFIVKGGPR